MRVLFIEDFPILQKSVSKGLTEAGFAVDVAGDGEQGLWYATTNEYDVIILDLMLPGIDGLTVLRKIREAGRQTHVLILTAKDTIDDRVAGLDRGADDYLVKPFAFSELLARVRALVRRSYQKKNPIVEVGDLRIDTASQRVWRGGQEISITAREFSLLEYLTLRRGEVVSRTDIWEHLYDFHSTGTSNVVDVYVGYLRKKIEREDAPPLIHTHRGRGYSIEASSA